MFFFKYSLVIMDIITLVSLFLPIYMTNENTYCVIMAGGIGSRFWPMSTSDIPKQFLDVLEIGRSLIQMTFDRFSKITDPERIFVITNEKYIDMVSEQLPEIPKENILGEPVMKNTAPVVTWAAHKINKINPDATLIVTPSDHLIINDTAFKRNVNSAINEAVDNSKLVTLGIKPTRPDTGYGYIHFETEEEVVPGSIAKVKKFTEKPNKELAEIFIKSGEYYWNSGIFIWTAKSILKSINKFNPELYKLFEVAYSGSLENEKQNVNRAFLSCENISIDYAVLEHAKNVSVVLATFNWSDLGTWGSLYDQVEKDSLGNSVSGDAKTLDIHNCLIKLPKGKKAIIQGLEDYIVVESKDGSLLIMQRNKEQHIKGYLKDFK
jgi:mannose-1-phosphate guanylyltransferase